MYKEDERLIEACDLYFDMLSLLDLWEIIMENKKLEEIHQQYITLIPLLYKCKGYFINKKIGNGLCNKNQVTAIMIIGKAGSIMPTTLSKFIDMEKGSLTTLVDSLVDKKLVIRSDDPNDRRKIWLSLTADGIANMKEIEQQSFEGIASMASVLEEEDINQLQDSLQTLSGILRKVAASTA